MKRLMLALCGVLVTLVVVIGGGVAAGTPGLASNPASHDYGTIDFGTTDPPSQSFELSNPGTVATAALKLSISGDDAAQFTIVSGSDGCSATSLGPKKKCSVAVQYTPSAPDSEDSASLMATSKKASVEVALTGAGVCGACATPTPTATPP
jgi:Cep192 domain 4